VSAARVDDRFVITVAGELDVATAPLLRAVADRAREAEVPHVHLELADLETMDSTGLKVVPGCTAAWRS
jgi:anti-anti-sigma factor